MSKCFGPCMIRPKVDPNLPASAVLLFLMSNNARAEYVVLRSYPESPTLSPRNSTDSDTSLRALEISQGPASSSRRGRGYARIFRVDWLKELNLFSSGRSYSLSGFDFQRDLVRFID